MIAWLCLVAGVVVAAIGWAAGSVPVALVGAGIVLIAGASIPGRRR